MPEVSSEVNHEPFPVDFNRVVEHPKGGDVYKAGYKKGLELDPVLTVSEWSEQNRILPSKSSSEPGRWRNSRTPPEPNSFVRIVLFEALAFGSPTNS